MNQLGLVNDNAERGVALIEKLNDKITTDEQQKQFLLQVVQITEIVCLPARNRRFSNLSYFKFNIHYNKLYEFMAL